MIEPPNSAAVEDSPGRRPKSKAVSESSRASKVSKVSKVSKASKRSKSPKAVKEPKKKKMSKKEAARLKREKAEQERLEQERREAEIRDQKEREYEQKKREEQQQRLAEEDAAINSLREQRNEEGRRIQSEKYQTEDWQIFTKCSHSVDARSTPDVNSFLTQWEETKDTDLKVLFGEIQQSNDIINSLTAMMQKAEVSQDQPQFDRCKDLIQRVRDLVQKKLEEITVHHLIFSDKFASGKNEILVTANAGGITFGMWVNLSKNPRNKEMTFPGIKIEFPKAVAMASIAIRFLTFSEKPYNEEYLFLDKMVRCEFIQLPTPPKRIGTMTLRQSPQNNTLARVYYPFKNISTAQPPLNFTVSVENFAFLQTDSGITVVLLKEDGTTTTEPITKVTPDPEKGELQFSAMAIGTFALAVPRYNQFPFEYWELNSTSETTFEIYLKTAQMELSIEINSDGKCSLENPAQYAFKDLTPGSTIDFLLERGINLISPNQYEGLNPKAPDLEALLAQGIADSGTGFCIRWSKWNSMLPADRAMLLVKQRKDFTSPEEESEDEDPNINNNNNNENEDGEAPAPADNNDNASQQPETAASAASNRKPPRKSSYRAILAKANHIVEVPNSEREEECATKPVNGGNIHLHLLPMLLEGATDQVRERVNGCPSFLCDSVLFFMKKLRLFSMSK